MSPKQAVTKAAEYHAAGRRSYTAEQIIRHRAYNLRQTFGRGHTVCVTGTQGNICLVTFQAGHAQPLLRFTKRFNSSSLFLDRLLVVTTGFALILFALTFF